MIWKLIHDNPKTLGVEEVREGCTPGVEHLFSEFNCQHCRRKKERNKSLRKSQADVDKEV